MRAAQAFGPGWHGLAGERLGQEPGGILGHAEETRTAAQQPGRYRSLHRVGRAQVGEPRGDRRGRESVISQRDEHRLEDPDLGRSRPLLGHQPQGKLAEADLPHQVRGEIVTEERDRLGA